ncbi:urease accessory protein UreD [Paenibacillus validus]|uniref:Urease accessory protein UreD n=1 Tax=Paenibacillus validus TaxID=44253 RepID=A0A7X2ZA87_9BACL|nr:MULTISPECIES: urease accessory protein UreD [Paenibacillus]MED4603349.1 urease accessory protein UreD [Paenibacillus validus]MED4607940.1 urease accessory protein UreD [Paenibacillus validus]MUG71117.1 urease accessory protein UreD [Paenibacillus validus]
MSKVSGTISADIVCANGSTQLRRHAQTYPLKIAKTFPFPGNQLGIYVMDASPGIMAGDCYELEWRIGETADVLITNQSYTKVHPPRDGENAVSEQRQRLHLGKDAYVEYMPEPLMLYRDATLISDTAVEMERGSTLMLSELTCPGRTHRGERFHYEKLRSRFTVAYDGEMIYQAKQQIVPKEGRVGVIPRWHSFTHLGMFYLFSERADAAVVEELRQHLSEFAAKFPELYVGVSLTYRYGLAVFVLGRRVFELQQLLHAAWLFVRQRLFDRQAFVIPK